MKPKKIWSLQLPILFEPVQEACLDTERAMVAIELDWDIVHIHDSVSELHGFLLLEPLGVRSLALRSAVYAHHGFLGSPPMKRTTEMNTSSKQRS